MSKINKYKQSELLDFIRQWGQAVVAAVRTGNALTAAKHARKAAHIYNRMKSRYNDEPHFI